MIYIELEENNRIDIKEEFGKNLIFKIINKLHIKSTKLIEEKFEDKTIIKISNLEYKTLNKLSKYIKRKCVCKVCASKNLMNNMIFLEFIKNEKVKFFDGKWLYKILTEKIIEYILTSSKEKIENLEISLLINKADDFNIYIIQQLAEKVKVLNVITEDSSSFKNLEKREYDENGIIINVVNNYKKSLLKSDIILNYDFSEEKLNNYIYPRKCYLINFSQPISQIKKNFEGININFYEIIFPQKYIKYLTYFKNFDTSILYESFVYKHTNIANILKEIDDDKIKIDFLIGKNGKIRKNEYLKMSKKVDKLT